ncbi:hypothetical protein KJ612_04460 [Myxococcota bacterium]|nr:hypothetical protein [Myxococcota bacterium]MBU1413085.1 hypothetical protein [Myxococcota bacterium]
MWTQLIFAVSLFVSTNPSPKEVQVQAFKQACVKDPTAAWMLATAGEDISGCLARVPAKLKFFTKVIEAEQLRRDGKLAEAAVLLSKSFSAKDAAPVRRLILAEILLFLGKVDEAMGHVDRIVDDYGRDFIGKTDWELWAAGSAAVLKKDWETAEDAFGKLDEGHPAFVPGQLAGGEYDRVREYYTRSLRRLQRAVAAASWHSPTLVAAARALFENPYAETSGDAVVYARNAIAADSHAIAAWQLLAKVAIYDLKYDEAILYLDKSDTIFKDHPLTLAYRASIALLHGRDAVFAEILARVVKNHPRNLEFYMETGRILNRHHRYPLAVDLFQKGLKLEPDNAALSAWLGMSLLRVGNEGDGVYHLRRAAQADSEHVMANNVTYLYTNLVFPNYVSVRKGPFLYRAPKDEWPVLSVLVPPVMEAAYERYRKAYGYTPPEPIHVELYKNPADFTTLIAGQPVDTGILGVCFGRVIVALSPSASRANWAMVLSHELAHTFHVEQTQGRVPRWFTEGLAELETARHNYVWKREMSRDLYMALSERSLRGIATLNEAFSHAKNELEMVTAYIHATWVVRFIYLNHGWSGIRKMLELYTRELPTPEVIAQVTGFPAAEFDRRFFAYLSAMFARFKPQFHPSSIKFADREQLTRDLAGGTADAFGRMALSHLLAGEKDDFKLVMDKARRLDAKNRWVMFSEALYAQSERNTPRALELLEELVRTGNDGFEIRQYLAFLYQLLNRRDDEIRTLEKAAAFDPENIQVRMRLALHYKDTSQEAGFIRMLREVARRNEGDSGVVRKLVELGAKNRDNRLAAEFGLQLLDISPFRQGEGPLQAATALFALGRPADALPLLRVHRLENPEDRLGRVRMMLARALVAAGRRSEARPILGQLVSLFPGMTEARELLQKIK